MSPHKHVPMRMCIICRDKKEKRQLTRIVKTDQGVFPDPTGKHNGRGAYLCDDPACRQRAIETDSLSKALQTTLSELDRERIRTIAR